MGVSRASSSGSLVYRAGVELLLALFVATLGLLPASCKHKAGNTGALWMFLIPSQSAGGAADPADLLTLQVTGLRGHAVVSNNGDTLQVDCDGEYAFGNKLAEGDAFHISVSSHPDHQNYVIDNPTGTIQQPHTRVALQFSNNPLPASSSILNGKLLTISSGHGVTYDASAGIWKFQRGIVNEIREDERTQKLAIDYLIPSLENCGARVVSVRERSYEGENAPGHIFIIDDASTSFSHSANWQAYGRGYSGASQRLTVGSSIDTATWTIITSRSGTSSLYVYITPEAGYAPAVEYTIAHAYGNTKKSIDQSHLLYFPSSATIKTSGVWFPLGNFYFKAGETYTVQVSSAGVAPGKKIIADAIRLGGGVGTADFGGGISGYMQWQQDALSFLREYDAPDWVFNNDVTARPLYALHHMVDAYLSVHYDVGSGREGTVTYIYNNAPPNPGTADITQVSARTVDLANRVNNRVVQIIQANWDATWPAVPLSGAYFGELRSIRDAWLANNSINIPAVLVEVAYMDIMDEAALLKNDVFLQDISHALTKAFIDYFSAQAGVTALYPPPAAKGLSASRSGRTVTLSWQESVDAVDPGTTVDYYLVYFSTDGVHFDGMPYKSATSSIDITVNRDDVLYFKVTAVNGVGQSVDSSIIRVD